MQRRTFVLAIPPLVPAAFGVGPARAAAAPGVVRFGQSAALSGEQAAHGRAVRDGVAAAFAAASRQGGTRFELVCLDDGGDKGRCWQNTRSLIDAGMPGLIGFTSGAAAEAALELVEETRIALLGTASGTMGIRQPRLAMQYHVRAGHDAEFHRMVSYVKEYGMRRVGGVYLQDSAVADLDAMSTALGQVGVRLTASAGLDGSTDALDRAARTLLSARLDCVLFTTPAAPAAALAQRLIAGRYGGLYVSSSLAGQALVEQMAALEQSLIMTQVVPRPNAFGLSVVSRCRRELEALGRGTRPGFAALEGYVTGWVAVEAARTGLRRGGELTRGRFREALAGLRVDLGGYTVDFTGGRTQGSRFVDVVALDRAGRIIG